MEYRRLGASGLAVSVVGLGCNNLGRRVDAAGTRALVDVAIEHGVNFFDTADVYGEPSGSSEELLGAAVKGHRDDVVIATKFGMAMGGADGPDRGALGGRRYIQRAVEASLRRLDTDHIDLYQLHRPDPATPIEETLSTLDELVRSGKVRYVGCSNFSGSQVADAAWTARVAHLTPFVSVQNQYSLLDREVERDVGPAAHRHGLGVLPYFPLASGLLTGKYHRDTPPPAGARLSEQRFAARLAAAPWDRIEALERFAAERGRTLLDVAIGGLAARPYVSSVIAGATGPEQLAANVAAATWKPDDGDLAELSRLLD